MIEKAITVPIFRRKQKWKQKLKKYIADSPMLKIEKKILGRILDLESLYGIDLQLAISRGY